MGLDGVGGELVVGLTDPQNSQGTTWIWSFGWTLGVEGRVQEYPKFGDYRRLERTRAG